jgi:hypothetical protein
MLLVVGTVEELDLPPVMEILLMDLGVAVAHLT